MSTWASDHDARLNRLAEDFADRYRRGERPSLSQYTDQYPDLAEEIRELFPAMVEIERVEEARREPGGPPREVQSPHPREVGDFLVLREIGRGGMGVVYEAVQQSLGRHVALKVLPWHATGESSQLERFRLEARAAAKLHHTNIVPVFGVGEQDGLHYYAMQFIRGQGLDDVIAELRQLREGPYSSRRAVASPPPGAGASTTIAASVAQALLTGRVASDALGGDAGAVATEASLTASARTHTTDPPRPGAGSSTADGHSGLTFLSACPYYRQVARVGLQVAEGLAYAHAQGILHRDIKPSNLLMDTHGTVWITDFGLAKAEGSDGPTRTGDIVGTLRYMSPERFDGRSDPRSDVYGLGATLYELLTLRPLFGEVNRAKLIERILHEPPPPPRALDHHIPHDLGTIVLKAIDKDPGRRYATADSLADDLRRFLADEPILARRMTAVEQYSRWARRNPVIAALGAAVTFLLFAVITGLWRGNQESRRALVVETALRADAVRRADESREITTFFTTLLDRATEPDHAKGQAVTVDSLMAKAEEMLATGSFDDQPLVEAELRHTIGRIQLRRYRTERAEPQLKRALELRTERLGPCHQDTLNSHVDYAWVLEGMGRNDEAQRQIEECWHRARHCFEPHHPRIRRALYGILTLSLWHNSGDRGEHLALLEGALQAIRSSPEDNGAETLEPDLLMLKADCLESEGRLTEARRELEDLLSRHGKGPGTESKERINSASIRLAEIKFALGEWGEAEARMEQVLRVTNPLYPGVHWTVWKPQRLLVRVALERGEVDRAQEILVAWTVPTHQGELTREIALAETAALRGDLDRARALRDRWWARSRIAGPTEEDPLSLAVKEGVVYFYPQLPVAAHVDVLCGNLRRARALCDRLLGYGLPRCSIGPSSGLWALNDLARTLATAPQTRDNPADAARAVALAELIVAAQTEVGYFKTTLGIARYRSGDIAGAIEALSRAEALRREENTAATNGFYLAMAHHRLGHAAEAGSWFNRSAVLLGAPRRDDRGLLDLSVEAEALLGRAWLDAGFPADPFAH